MTAPALNIDEGTPLVQVDDLAQLLSQLSVPFLEHEQNGQRWADYAPAGATAFPRLCVQCDRVDPRANARIALTLIRCEADARSGGIPVASTEDVAALADVIRAVASDGITLRLFLAENSSGAPCLYLRHNDAAIDNPFVSEIDGTPVSPAHYGLDQVTGEAFLNGMPIGQLRTVIGVAIGNTDVFDGCMNDAEKREFAADYLAEALAN